MYEFTDERQHSSIVGSTALRGESQDSSQEVIEVSRVEWVKTRCEANSWKSHYRKSKAREAQLHAEIRELRQEQSSELKLQRKVAKLKSQLQAFTGVSGSSNVLVRQGRMIKQLRETIKQLRNQVKGLGGQLKQLQADNAVLGSSNARLTRTVFGEKSERTKKRYDDAHGAERTRGSGNRSKRREGTGKRRDLSHLPVIEERVEVDAEQGRCPRCGKEYVLHGHEESELVELQVEAYRRRIVRQRKRAACCCSEAVEAVAAPVDRLFAGSRYGISVWGMYLFQRFAMHQTVGGFGRMSEAFGLPLSASTLVSRNASFLSMFGPLFNAIREHQSEASEVHGDETSWPIQVAGVRNGEHYRGWLWVCVSADAVSMHINRSRSAAAGMVLFERFGQCDSPPVLVCDRYSAYLKLSKDLGVTLAFCWAHVRRDFIHAGGGEPWREEWLDRIGMLYRINRQRWCEYQSEWPMSQQSSAFQHLQRQLEGLVEEFFAQVELELDQLTSECAQYQPLNSLSRYRSGFSIFVNQPEVPMDNNLAERTLRPAVISRKLSYGSKSELAAQLTSCLLSIVETLRLNQIKVYDWLLDYLAACATNHGEAPSQCSEWLPWQMDDARRRRLQIAARAQGP